MRVLLSLVFLCFASWISAEPRKTIDVAYGNDPSQRFDVYWDDSAENAPVIVMLHGGAWAIGDKINRAVWQEKVAYWRPRGYVFISVNTRLLPDAAPADQAEDLARAVAVVQSKARTWGGNPRQVVLMGHSAGAHLAALVGTSTDYHRRHGIVDLKGAVILDTATLDLVALMRDNPARLYRKAFGTEPANWRILSPSVQLDRGAPPVLVVCSSRRNGVCDQARTFSEVAARKSLNSPGWSGGLFCSSTVKMRRIAQITRASTGCILS